MVTKEGSLEEFIKFYVKEVDAKLDEIVPSESVKPFKLHSAIRHSLFAGGKRFRPICVFAVGKAFGAPDEKLVTAAAAIEMIHTYSLIHDDLPSMDDDDLRRGKKTCHVEFGEATAILAGNALETFAFQAVAEDKSLSPEIRVKLICEIAKSAGTPDGMISGQQADLKSEGKKVSIEELKNIHRKKTGAMIQAASRAGAIIANVCEEKLNFITRYAANLGLLFQIIDDLLDVTQMTEILGKTAGKDIFAGKATYPSVYGIEKTRKLAEDICERAHYEISEIDSDMRLLKQLAKFILKRKK